MGQQQQRKSDGLRQALADRRRDFVECCCQGGRVEELARAGVANVGFAVVELGRETPDLTALAMYLYEVERYRGLLTQRCAVNEFMTEVWRER